MPEAGLAGVIQSHQAARYVTPLREGGSLPAILETEDGGLFVTKFRGAGQGAMALIAELISGGIAAALGLEVPELATIELGEDVGESERDAEIQDLLNASRGTNVGLRFLEGALNFDVVGSAPFVDPEWAARVVWLDAYITNIDRTARNPNMMVWDDRIVLIDHGASLYFHHNWAGVTDETARRPFPMIRDHVLLRIADGLSTVGESLAPMLTDSVLADILKSVPDSLLEHVLPGQEPAFPSAELYREGYFEYLTQRRDGRSVFEAAVMEAQQRVLAEPKVSLQYRR